MSLLLSASVRALPILAAVLLLCAIFPRSAPEVRHAAITGSLAALLLLPLLALALPELPLPVLQASVHATEAAPGASISSFVLSGEPAGSRPHTATLLAGVWAAGFGLGAARLILGIVVNQRHMQDAAAAGRVLRVGGRGRTRVIFSKTVTTPSTSGLFRAVVLLPGRAAGWTPAERRAVLRHEFAHVRRGDAWTRLIGQVARTLHWFNPVVWMACRAQRRTSEEAADAVVAGREMSATDFAALLVRLVRAAPRPAGIEPVHHLSTRSTLGIRVSRLIEGGWNPPHRGRLGGMAILLLALLFVAAAGEPTFTADTAHAFARHHGVADHTARLVLEAAAAERVAPAVAFGLVRVESDFDAGLRSPGGAVGLAQVLPSTARSLNPGVGEADLWHPETNLRFGFRLLRRYLDYYHGDLDRALLAYAQGPHSVDSGAARGASYASQVRRAARLIPRS